MKRTPKIPTDREMLLAQMVTATNSKQGDPR